MSRQNSAGSIAPTRHVVGVSWFAREPGGTGTIYVRPLASHYAQPVAEQANGTTSSTTDAANLFKRAATNRTGKVIAFADTRWSPMRSMSIFGLSINYSCPAPRMRTTEYRPLKLTEKSWIPQNRSFSLLTAI